CEVAGRLSADGCARGAGRQPVTRETRQPALSVSAPEEHDLRERERIGVRDRQKRTAGAHRVEPALRAGMELEARWATVAHDFHALPEHILRVSRSERLHRGFL